MENNLDKLIQGHGAQGWENMGLTHLEVKFLPQVNAEPGVKGRYARSMCEDAKTFGNALVMDHVLLGWVRKVQLTSRSWTAEVPSILAKRVKHMHGIMYSRKQDGLFYVSVPPRGQVSPLLQLRMVPFALKLPGTACLTQMSSCCDLNVRASPPTPNSHSANLKPQGLC